MQLKFNVVISVMVAFLYGSAAYTEGPEREENSLIPKAFQPIEYALAFDMKMDDEKHLFFGTAFIRLECLVRSNVIILNTKDLFLDKDGTRVFKEGLTSELEPLRLSSEPMLETVKQWLVISLEKEVEEKEKILIQLVYHKFTDISEDLNVAFVKYKYSRKLGENAKWLAVSIPGAINARKLYPCIDEPAVKTTVRMNVVRDENFISLSNTFILYDKIRRSTAWDRKKFVCEPYHNTPSLSTFSIGFVIGDLKDIVKTDQSSGVEIRILSDKAVIRKMEFAVDTAVRVVGFYREYFNSKFGVYHMDVAALPFYGRTDKWGYGLITLEESLIINENPSTQVREIETAFTLCDVFCHQYFGPQTTFKTWSENWLNMGFALFYRIPCIQNIFQKKGSSIAKIHQVESFIRVLSVEAEIKSRPVMIPDSRLDLTNLFQDTVLAETAYFLVRMMSYFLGKDILFEQVKNYIAKFRFKVTSLEELWKKFPLGKKNSELLPPNTTLKDIMDSWTLKAGFAHIKMTRNRKHKFVTIRQELIADSDKTNPRIIPLNFVTKSESREKHSTRSEEVTKKSEIKRTETTNQFARKNEKTKLSNKEKTVQHWLHSEPITIPVEMNDWIVLNSRLNVLCRVEYDPITLKLLGKTLMNKKTYKMIDVMARTQLISDLFALAEIGKLSYSILLEFMSYLKHEKSHLPIMVALHELNRIRLGLFGTEIFFSFQGYVQEILEVIIKERKFDIKIISENKYEKHYFKKLIFTSACTFRVRSCIETSKVHFAKLLDGGTLSVKTNPIPAGLHEPFYCQAIRESDKEWDFLFSFYNNQQWEYSNDIVLNALACTADGGKLTTYLEHSLNPEKIAPRDSLTVFKSVASNEKGYTRMITFFRYNFDDILRLNENNPSKVYRYLEILYENVRQQTDLNELDGFTKSYVSLENIQTHLKESRQIAEKNILWLKNMKVQIHNFFNERKISSRVKKALSSIINLHFD